MYQFGHELNEGEKVVWQGQPETNAWFSPADIFLVPLGFLLLALLFLSFMGNGEGLSVVGIAIILLGIYVAAGRYIVKYYKKKQTHYAITDRRIMIIVEFMGRTVKSTYIDALADVNVTKQADGVGTITFGRSSFVSSIFANSGMDIFGKDGRGELLAFFDIKDAETVARLLETLRKK